MRDELSSVISEIEGKERSKKRTRTSTYTRLQNDAHPHRGPIRSGNSEWNSEPIGGMPEADSSDDYGDSDQEDRDDDDKEFFEE